MQASMWTAYLVEQLPREAIKTFYDHGWRCVELGEEHAHDLLKEGDPLKVGAEFRKYINDLGVDIPQGHFFMLNKGCRPEDLEGRRLQDMSPAKDVEFAASVDFMKRWIDLFNAIGIKAGVYHIGGFSLAKARWSKKRIFERRVRALQQVAEYAKGGPTQICLENMTRKGDGGTVAELKEFLFAVGSDCLAICLDTGHANIAGVDQAEFVQEAQSDLRALHVADNLGHGDDHMLPYGRGTVKWTPFMQALRKTSFKGSFNFEVPGEIRCPEPVLLHKLDYALELAKWMIDEDGA